MSDLNLLSDEELKTLLGEEPAKNGKKNREPEAIKGNYQALLQTYSKELMSAFKINLNFKEDPITLDPKENHHPSCHFPMLVFSLLQDQGNKTLSVYFDRLMIYQLVNDYFCANLQDHHSFKLGKKISDGEKIISNKCFSLLKKILQPGNSKFIKSKVIYKVQDFFNVDENSSAQFFRVFINRQDSGFLIINDKQPVKESQK